MLIAVATCDGMTPREVAMKNAQPYFVGALLGAWAATDPDSLQATVPDSLQATVSAIAGVFVELVSALGRAIS